MSQNIVEIISCATDIIYIIINIQHSFQIICFFIHQTHIFVKENNDLQYYNCFIFKAVELFLK